MVGVVLQGRVHHGARGGVVGCSLASTTSRSTDASVELDGALDRGRGGSRGAAIVCLHL